MAFFQRIRIEDTRDRLLASLRRLADPLVAQEFETQFKPRVPDRSRVRAANARLSRRHDTMVRCVHGGVGVETDRGVPRFAPKGLRSKAQGWSEATSLGTRFD